MKTNRNLNITAGLVASAFALLVTPAAHAAINYHVTINTAALNSTPANANAPFSLDFQLTDGSGTFAVPNTVTLSNFTFGGGAAVGAATTTAGATGNLGSTIMLSDTSEFPTELYQQFTPGSTLGFDVSMTTLSDPGTTPDAFSVAILDNNLFNVTTTGPGDSLVLANISNTLTPQGVQYFQGTGDYVGLSAIPEPGTALFGIALLGALGMARRRQPQAATAA